MTTAHAFDKSDVCLLCNKRMDILMCTQEPCTPKPLGEEFVVPKAPRPSDFVEQLLSLFPNGLPAKIMVDVMVERGLDREECCSAVRRGLDRGVLGLGPDLNIVRV